MDGKRTYGILSPELVRRAIDKVYPLIELLMQDPDVRGDRLDPGLAVVVTATSDINPCPTDKPDAFAEHCYYVGHVGGGADADKLRWGLFALQKAMVSARTGLPTAKVPPQMLIADDVKYWGSAVLDGIVVGCSGLSSEHDEMFAYCIAAAVQAEAKIEFGRRKEDKSRAFI